MAELIHLLEKKQNQLNRIKNNLDYPLYTDIKDTVIEQIEKDIHLIKQCMSMLALEKE